MRVLVLSTVFPNARRPAYGTFVRDRVRHLAAHCELQVVAPIPWFPPQRRWRGGERADAPAVENQLGFPVYHPRVLSVPGVVKSLDGLLYCLSLLRLVRRLRVSFPFDVIDAHFGYPAGVGAALLGRALRCPVVITLRGNEVAIARHVLRRQQIRFALSHARVIAVSDSLRNFATDLGVAPERVRVIPNGIDASQFRPSDKEAARARLGLPRDRPILLAVGAFLEHKGHERMLDLLPRLTAQHPDILYVAVGNRGGGDSRFPAIERRVRDEQLASRVRLELGRPHEEMPLWMAAADLFCLATGREGWSNAITEALACGLPVVTTRVGGNAEIVRDGEDGFLIPFFDADAFVAAVERGLRHAWDRAAIAQRAAAWRWEAVASAAFDELQHACRSPA